MGEARRRQPNKDLRVAEAVERVRLENEEREFIRNEAKQTQAKLKYEQRQAILIDDTLDDETKDQLLRSLDRRKIKYNLLSMMATSAALMSNPHMAPYADLYTNLSRRRGKSSLGLSTPNISSGVVRKPKDSESGKSTSVVNVGTIGHIDHNRTTLAVAAGAALERKGRKVIIADNNGS